MELSPSHQGAATIPDVCGSSIRIFVGDLSFFCTEGNLRQLFQQFGDVKNVEIRRSEETNGSLMHGFVEMESSREATLAAAELDSKKFMGRRIRVVVGGNNSRQGGKAYRSGWVQIQVSFVSRRMDTYVNEELLDSIFSGYGEVMDVTIKKHHIDSERKNQSGYGFVFYASFEESMKAVHSVKRATLNGITFDCNLTHRSEQQLKKHLDTSPSAVSSSSGLTSPPLSASSSSSPPPHPQHLQPQSAPRTTQHTSNPVIPNPSLQANYSVSQQPSYPPFISASPPVAYQQGYTPSHHFQSMREVSFIHHHAPFPSHHYIDANLAMNYPNYHPQPLIHPAMSQNNRMDTFHMYGSPMEFHTVPFGSPPIPPLTGGYSTHAPSSHSSVPSSMLVEVNSHLSVQQGASPMGRNSLSPRLSSGYARTPPSASSSAGYPAALSSHPTTSSRRPAPSTMARATQQRVAVSASISSSHSASTSPLLEPQSQQPSPSLRAASPQSTQVMPSSDNNHDGHEV